MRADCCPFLLALTVCGTLPAWVPYSPAQASLAAEPWSACAAAADGRYSPLRPSHRAAADKATTEQALAALDAEIEASAVMAHFVWTLDRFSRFMDSYAKLYPERAQISQDLSARWRNDQEEALDAYTKLLLQITTGPARDAVSERVAAIRQDMDDRGQGRLKGYLPVLLRHVLELQTGLTPSREQMRTAILSVPNVAGGH